ncbi:DUF2577 domain-containing protein [Paenibacillus sp.]|uniref:DUF2577 domain-containing protein n=1 Tax=Paenibacillus sp. TaxID=58172 RepID=UPI002812667C|nr:DUF2577 domain-containing protein [Paenibacillus sp.]
MSIVDKIRRISAGTQEAGDPVAVLQGTVESVQPLAVRLDQRIMLPGDALVIPAGVAERGLDVGDKLILLRVQGGQRFVVLDKAEVWT